MGYEYSASHDPVSKTLERFFCGFAEYIFHSRLGIADTELVTYVSDLLVRFTKMESMHRIRQLNGRPAIEVVSMMAEAEQRIGIAKREVHRHIGDFALFWTGLYPESLRELQGPDRRDQFVSYCHQGKRAYEIASKSSPILKCWRRVRCSNGSASSSKCAPMACVKFVGSGNEEMIPISESCCLLHLMTEERRRL